MSKKLEKVVDLEFINISPEVYAAWMNIAATIGPQLIEILGKNIAAEDVPLEQFRIFPNGNGQIFVDLPNNTSVSLDVPKGHWAYNQSNN